MSVLTYVYPAEVGALAFDRLFQALQRAVPMLEVVECLCRPRSSPDWSSLVVRDGPRGKFEFVFEIGPNLAANKRGLLLAFPDSPSVAVASQASKRIWSQMQGGHTSDRVLMREFDTWNDLIATLAKISKGVVYVPENERLYSATGFARHVTRDRANRPDL